MIAYQYLRISIHLLAGLWTCAVIFPRTDAAGRERRIQRWSGQLLSICGVQLEVLHLVDGQQAPASNAMIVSNHVSWLDIFVINTYQPCRFVAKADVRDWPLIGWLSSKAGTVFLARGNRREVKRIYAGLVAAVHAGERVAFFPEGTTTEQGMLLPFHANLFEAAIEAAVPVQPYALRYLDASGALHPAVAFIGDMSFAQSISIILKARQIRAELVRLPVIETTGAQRRDIAQASRSSVAQALGHRQS
ncbi:MAG: 1-acyl-sn-glycerol-3-phosphate acyltransferase [Glaciimonas sp.]|nr:1-acyl-sn-glycerol-3-phosphate acyltransferase [Glaciimonas sp.]